MVFLYFKALYSNCFRNIESKCLFILQFIFLFTPLVRNHSENPRLFCVNHRILRNNDYDITLYPCELILYVARAS